MKAKFNEMMANYEEEETMSGDQPSSGAALQDY